MTPWRRRLRRSRLVLVSACAFALIAMALMMGLVQLALPWVVSHPEYVTTFLSDKLHRPISIDRMESTWERGGPVLTLHGLHLGAADPTQQAMMVPQAALALNFFAWMHKNQRWNEFRVNGLDLTLSHDAPDGSWRIHGMGAAPVDQSHGDNPLFQLGSLVLHDLHLRMDDTPNQRQLQFGVSELRLINNGSAHRLLARVQCLETQSPPMALVAEYHADLRSGQLYLGASQLDLAGLLRLFPIPGLALASGDGDAQFWVDWRSGALNAVRAEVDLRKLILQTTASFNTAVAGDIVPRVSFDRLAFGARLQRSAQGWLADVADLRMDREGLTAIPAQVSIEQRSIAIAPAATNIPEASIASAFDDAPDKISAVVNVGASSIISTESPEYIASASALDLSALASLSMLSDALPMGIRQWLYNASPRGVVDTVNMRYYSAQDYAVQARVSAISWMPVDKLPGAEGLSIEALGDAQTLSITLPAQTPVHLSMPQLFRSTIELSDFIGNVAAYRTDNAWRIEIPSLQFEGQPIAGLGYGGEVRGTVDIYDDGSSPLLDVYAAISHADVLAMHQFWPFNAMPKQGVAWLDRSLVGGYLTGRAALRGNLDDWPFHNLLGQFSAHVELEEATLDYNPEWPRVEHLRASADFLNTSLHVSASTGQSLGNLLSSGTADIADFAHAIIEIQLAGSGSGKSLLDFLNASPIGKRYAEQLRGVDIGGTGKLNLQLHLPLGNDQGPLKLDGSVDMLDADLSARGPNLHLSKANGKVTFSERGFSIEDMMVRYDDQPARFSLRVGTAYMHDAQHQAEASLQGKLPVTTLLKHVPVLLPYQKFIQGSADWAIDYSVDDSHGKGDSPQRLRVSSDLKGIAITLPAPLHKDSNEIQPLHIIIPLPFEGAEMQARLGDIAQMRARLEKGTTPFAGHLAFGAGMPGMLPKRGLRISGGVVEADISGWMDFGISNNNQGSDSFIESVDLGVAQLMFFGRAFADTAFKLSFSPDENTLNLSGSQLEGTVHIPAVDLIKRGITAELKRLYMSEADDTSALQVSEQPPANSLAGINPALIPPLHVLVGDLHLGHASFGAARLESYPIDGGMHLEQVQSDSPNIHMSARGDWLGKGGKDYSTFSIHFTAKNLGHMLDALGYVGVIDGGETVVNIDASWPGAPSSFTLSKLDGTLNLSVADGRILEVDPGAGRIIGLFGITEIPRRLALDFSDFFKSGLAFNSIKGKFSLHNGTATTDDLQIKGPAADIAITGRTDLRAREYDQTMKVVPHLSNTLPIVGAIAGGPLGAAAGFVVQSILRKPLNQAGETTYRVSGSWDKPTIVLVAKTTKAHGKLNAPQDASKQK